MTRRSGAWPGWPVRRMMRTVSFLSSVADELDEVEPGGVGLHDDVEQDHGHVGMPAHELAAFGRRIGREDFEALAVQPVVAEREPRAVVHGRLVVDHRDLPARAVFRGGS